MSSLCCGCPVAFCAALRLVASIALLASSSGAAIAARCPSAAPALPSAAPARGVVAALAAERSRPTAPRDGSNCLACPGVGASTGAPLLAVVHAAPGDLQGPRAGAHGCATFLSLVSLPASSSSSSCLLPSLCPLTTAILGNRASFRVLVRCPKQLDCSIAYSLRTQHPKRCQLSAAAESHCSQRWTK